MTTLNHTDWPRAGVPPLARALLRVTPEDFIVDEQIDIALSGVGEHLWLNVRKRGFNTDAVARQLAQAAGVPPRAVSYAGMKDRHAITTQWFSIHLPGREDPDLTAALPSEIEVLVAHRHARKLQRGALTGNRFSIVLRDCEGGRDPLQRRVEEVGRGGVPNYFGEQRFGRDHANIARAEAMFGGERIRDHHQRGIYLSAARSLIFNEVLAHRIAAGTWNGALEGDVFVLNGSNSFFVPDAIDEVIKRRLAEGDIHVSGPLWGAGEPPSRADVRAQEEAVAQRYTTLADGLARAELKQERRALRLVPKQLVAEWLDATTLKLSFILPAGTYATTVLREFACYRDVHSDAKIT